MISTITLDTYKQQIGSGDAFNLSDSFNGRVGDEQVPLVVQFKEQGLAQQFQDGLVPFLSGFVGSLDENGQVTAETGEAVSYVGTSDDIVGLGRVKMNLPGTMFPQEGFFYGFLGLQNADGKRVTTFNVWFHVYNGNPDMFVNKAPFRTELQKLLDSAEALVKQTNDQISAQLKALSDQVSDSFSKWNTDYATIQQTVTALTSQLTDLAQKIKDGNVVTHADFATAQAAINELTTGWNQFKNTNVVSAGIDNTGTKDVAADLQALIDSGTYGLYFPAGVYTISKPVEFPYDTNYPYTVELNANAHVVATAGMDAMFKLGEKQATPDTLPYLKNNHYSELYGIKGGYFHGNLNAQTAIQTGINTKGFKIGDMTLDGCLTSYLHLQRSNGSFSHDAIVSDIRIGYVSADEDASNNAIGIQADGGDWQLTSCYIANCKTAIKSAGLVTVTNVHVFKGFNIDANTAFKVPGGMIGSEVYIDSYNTGISTLMDNGQYAGSFISLSNLFYFEYTNNDISRPVHVIDTVDDTAITIDGIRTVFSTKRGNDGSQVIYLRQTDQQNALSSKSNRLNISGIDNTTNDDVAGTNNAIGDMLYSGANQTLNSLKVTEDMTVANNTGVIIGWIPYPEANNGFYAQSFELSESNKYFIADCSLRVIRNNDTVFVNNDKSNGYVSVRASSNENLQIGIGQQQTVNGKDLLPVYLYYNGAGTYFLPELTITLTDTSHHGMLFPRNPATAPVPVPSLLANTTNNSIGMSYYTDGSNSAKGIIDNTASSTDLNNYNYSGIYRLQGGVSKWVNGPKSLDGTDTWGYLKVVTLDLVVFQELHNGDNTIYVRNNSGSPSSWGTWKQLTLTDA